MTIKTMETDALLALLREAYPEHSFHLEPYQVCTARRFAVILTHADVAIHDPLVTDCGRFPKDDHYGLTKEHARLLRRHNREYAKYVLGQISDLPFIFERLVDLVTSQPDMDPTELLDDFGFISWHTGGGCMSYALFNPDGHYILVTDNEGSAVPKKMGEAWIGMYDNDEGEVRGFFPEPVSLSLAKRLTGAQSGFLAALGQFPATEQSQALHQALTDYQCQVTAAVSQWLNDQLPYGSTAKTEDGSTFVFRHGSWTDGQRTFNGLADFHDTFQLAIPRDTHVEQGGSEDGSSSAEVVADIAFTAGHLAALNEITVTDSRELMHDIMEWSKQFEAAFSKERHGEHYIELIDTYASYRLHGDHSNAESVLARMQHQ